MTPSVSVSILSAQADGVISTVLAGQYPLPPDPSLPWILPRHTEHAALAHRLAQMPNRLSDFGWTISTGPLVWNRYKGQLFNHRKKGTIPIVWAEAIQPDGEFSMKYVKRGEAKWFLPSTGVDDSLIVRDRVGLLQRTTAKEQCRRLVAAALPQEVLNTYHAVTVENHVNMIRASIKKPKIGLDTIVAVLNSNTLDSAFRCVSGSVAVSAFELERGLPLPELRHMTRIDEAIHARANPLEVEALIISAYT